MALFLLATLTFSLSAALSPGQCCLMGNIWKISNNCNECDYGYENKIGHVTSGCGWANLSWMGGFTWGQCKKLKIPGGSLKEESCCVQSGISWPGVQCQQDCPWGWTDELLRLSDCGWLNSLTVGLATILGKCNKKPDNEGLNDMYLTSRLMRMSVNLRYNNVGDHDSSTWTEDIRELTKMGYNFESTFIGSDSFHVIEADRTTFDEPGAHIIYFYGKHGDNTELVIGFPGSATIYDWASTNVRLAVFGAADRECFKTHDREKFCGSKSLVEHYLTTRDQFLAEISELLEKSCARQCVDVIRVLGHSLGGSAAQYGAIDMAKRFTGEYKVWLSTFASVRALDPASSNQASALLTGHGNRAKRYMLWGDIVPYAGSGLDHFGQAYMLEKSELYRKDRFYMPSDRMARVCCPTCPSTKQATDAIISGLALRCLTKNHAMVYYIDEIEKIKANKRFLLKDGRVPPRRASRRCSALPPCNRGCDGKSVSASECAKLTEPARVEDGTVVIPNGSGKGGRIVFSLYCDAGAAPLQLAVEGFWPAGNADSYYIELDNRGRQTWHVSRSAEWVERDTPLLTTPSKGFHTVTFHQREDGVTMRHVRIISQGCRFTSATSVYTEEEAQLGDMLDNEDMDTSTWEDEMTMADEMDMDNENELAKEFEAAPQMTYSVLDNGLVNTVMYGMATVGLLTIVYISASRLCGQKEYASIVEAEI